MPENQTSDRLPAIEHGAVLQVSDAGGGLKYVSRFVGVDGDVVISRLPAVTQLKKSEMGSDDLTYRDTFFQKRKLVMRLITNGHVYAFETEVIDLFLLGSKLLMSSYPKTVQHRMLRKEPRYPCALSASLQVGEEEMSGIMINFSSNGGLCQFTDEINQEALQKAKQEGLDVVMKLQLPFDENPEQLKGKLMSISGKEKQVGLSFIEGKESIQRYITSLKLESISDHF